MSEFEERTQAECIVVGLLNDDVVEALDILSNVKRSDKIKDKIKNLEEFDNLLGMAGSLIKDDERMMNRLITNALTIFKEQIDEACDDE